MTNPSLLSVLTLFLLLTRTLTAGETVLKRIAIEISECEETMAVPANLGVNIEYSFWATHCSNIERWGYKFRGKKKNVTTSWKLGVNQQFHTPTFFGDQAIMRPAAKERCERERKAFIKYWMPPQSASEEDHKKHLSAFQEKCGLDELPERKPGRIHILDRIASSREQTTDVQAQPPSLPTHKQGK